MIDRKIIKKHIEEGHKALFVGEKNSITLFYAQTVEIGFVYKVKFNEELICIVKTFQPAFRETSRLIKKYNMQFVLKHDEYYWIQIDECDPMMVGRYLEHEEGKLKFVGHNYISGQNFDLWIDELFHYDLTPITR